MKQYFWLLVVILLTSIPRVQHLNQPLMDWHSFRQVDTASVTREYLNRGINLLEPRYHDLSNIQSGLDNPEGYRMVEFPLNNAMIATLIAAFPQFELVATSRSLSVLYAVVSALALVWLVSAWTNSRAGILAGVLFALFPYGQFYFQTTLPEPGMVAFSLLSLATFEQWLRTDKNWLLLISALCLATALLLKPFVVFVAPVYLSQLVSHRDLRQLIHPKMLFRGVVFALIAFAPVLWWREWIQQYPEGIPASDWLYNGNGIRLRPAWFRWIGWERITKLMGGYTMTLVLPLFLLNQSRARTHLVAWWIGLLGFLIVFATGNVQHDYYQVILTPAIVATLAVGIHSLYLRLGNTRGTIVATLAGVLLAVGWVISWRQVRQFYSINAPAYASAGAAVDRLTPPDALVIAPQMGDTTFLFQTGRRGWPVGVEIEDKINKGATHYVSINNDNVARFLEEKYIVLEKTPEYIVIELTER